MKSSTAHALVVLAVASASLGFASTASAEHRNDGHRHADQRRSIEDRREARRQDRREDRFLDRRQDRRDQYRDNRGDRSQRNHPVPADGYDQRTPPPPGKFGPTSAPLGRYQPQLVHYPHHGGYQQVVHDWRGQRLTAPPHGQQWVRQGDGANFALIAIATGVIAAAVLNQR